MANNTTALNTISSNVLLCSVGFKFIAMIIGILGNVTVIIHTFLLTKEKTATSYLVGNLALADLLVCLTFYPIWIVELIQVILKLITIRICFVSLAVLQFGRLCLFQSLHFLQLQSIVICIL